MSLVADYEEPLYDYEQESEEPKPNVIDMFSKKISVFVKPTLDINFPSKDLNKSIERRGR